MSEPKFTKGPWKNVKKQDYYNLGVTEHYYDVYEIRDENNKIITKLDAEGMGKDKNIKANAALIVAAPELYDMLQKILDEHVIPTYKAQMAQDVIRILKKARGEQ